MPDPSSCAPDHRPRALHADLVIAAVVLVVVAAFSRPATAQHLLSRTRITNHMDDVTFVPSGPLANHIVWIDHACMAANRPRGWAPASGAGALRLRLLLV